MLSFFISNVLIFSNSLFGLNPVPVKYEAANEFKNLEVQTFTSSSTTPPEVHREEFVVEMTPDTQVANLGSQIVSQSLPASNSVLINSAMKYLGTYWDCTMLVEQALRDLGHSVPDLAPTSFGGYGTVFYDPSQVQAGDIMMRNGHVSIYAGDGMAIHGGFGFGGVVYTNWDSNPSGYSSFVRVG